MVDTGSLPDTCGGDTPDMDRVGIRNRGRRSVRLVLLPEADRTDWIIFRRTTSSGEHSDLLLARGSLRYTEGRLAPRDLIADLRRIAWELERLYQRSRPEGAPEPPEGATGGQPAIPGLDQRDFAVSHAGDALDAGPNRR